MKRVLNSAALGSRLATAGAVFQKDRWPGAVLAGIAGIAIIVFRFRLWQFDLSVPLSYRQDALYFQVMVKALGEGAWNDHIARLGAPFGLDMVDFPIRCSLDYLVMKVFMLLLHNPFLVVNVYWLVSVGLAGAAAVLFFRYLQVGALASTTFGVLFAIIPFVFFRSVAHLNLVTYLVPAGAFLAMAVVRGDILERGMIASGKLQKLVGPALLCLAIGLTYGYWAFFSCILIALGALVGLYRQRKVWILPSAALLIALIGLGTLINVGPSLAYWRRNGRDSELSYKNKVDADTYGLRVRQMLTPVAYNGLPLLQRIRGTIVGAGFPEDAKDANESVSATLGTLGSIGFVLLLVIALATCAKGADSGFPETPRILAALTIGLVLIAHTGGLGGFFNIFVTSEFRCYNRVSPFISLFSLAVLAQYFDRILARSSALVRVGVSVGLITFAAFDQIPLYYLSFHREIEREFQEDATTFRVLQTRLPAQAMVFQLPFMPFPVDAGVQGIPYYENAKAYLQTATLRWSWGEMMGRHGNWNQTTAALPTEAMLQRISFAGFKGLLLNRGGYADRKREDELNALVGPPMLVSNDERWVAYDLHFFSERMRAAVSAEEWSAGEQKAKKP